MVCCAVHKQSSLLINFEKYPIDKPQAREV